VDNKEYVYVDDDRQAQEAVDFLMKHDRLGYDTETTGLQLIGNISKLLLMQLGTEDVTYIFDPRKIDAQILKEPLESTSILKVLHNAKFDYQSTKLDTGIILTNVFDTMLAYRSLTSGLIEDGHGGFVSAGFRDKTKKHWPYKSLDFLSKKYLGIALKKDVRETFVDHQYNKEFTVAQLKYAAEDIAVLHPLCDILSQALTDEDLIDTALLEFAFVRPAAEMEMNGVFINKTKWRKIISEAKSQTEILEATMSDILAPLSDQNTLFGMSTVNIKSPDQLMDAFRKLGIELQNTDEKALKKISHPLAKLILEHRAYTKLISTYGEVILKKINRNTNRLHFTLHQMGADTGRLSSEKPNIQNIPQDREDAEVKISFRDCFEAEEGNKILTADYSQCVAEDELVSTQWGLIPIQKFVPSASKLLDLSKGEKILDSGGHKVPSFTCGGLVESNFSIDKGEKQTVKIKTAEGFEITCTPDHLIKTVDNYGNRNWKEAGRLTDEDYLVLSRDWVVSDKNPQVDLDPEAALFVGYFIGDGSFSSGGLQIAKGEDKYNDVFYKLKAICEKQFYGLELKNYSGTNSWDLVGKAMHGFMEHIGVRKGWVSGTKEVPKSVLEGGRPIIACFLKGLFEADGWVINSNSNHVVAFSSRSETLSRQVQLLLLSIGVFSKRVGYQETTVINNYIYHGTQWRVSICDSFNIAKFYEQVGFLSDIKNSILESLVRSPHRSQADYVILDNKDKSTLIGAAKFAPGFSKLRCKNFANYFNSNRSFIRHYSRYKLLSVCSELNLNPIKEHLAFSKVAKIEKTKDIKVYDLSVPHQNMFVAGGVFVHNCELRILAEESQDAKFLEIFRNDDDLHIITSQQVFGYTDAQLDTYLKLKKKDHPDVNLLDLFSAEEVGAYKIVGDFRDKTKTINFGIVYGLSAWSLAEGFKIPQEEAEGILDNYFRTYSGIKRWLGKNAYATVANRYASTILGRKKYFELANPEDEEAFRRSKGATRRMGNNHVIQGTNADITKEALVRLQEAYDLIEGAKLLFTVHDEIVTECPESVAEYAAGVKAEVMKAAFHRFIKTVPVGKNDEVSVTVAGHWSK
jgi:DNA polymerase I-like protein with 3'-5' exonuclease and polymerase domains/intein/homing endonuclease